MIDESGKKEGPGCPRRWELSFSEIETLMFMMSKYSVCRLAYGGLELERNVNQGVLRVPVYPPAPKPSSEEERPKAQPKKPRPEPSDDDLLLNPYVGLEQ